MSIYIFLDESGNLDFFSNGTRYYCFGALSTRDPKSLNHALTDLRYDLLDEGLELERFHAAEDRQAVRDRVFETLVRVGGFDFDAIIIEKRKANPRLHDDLRFYPQFSNHLLSYVFRRHPDRQERIVVATDQLPLKRTRKAAEKAIKGYIRQNLGARPFVVLHHPSAAHPCLQAADYCIWAVYRKWQSGDFRSYRLIEPFVRSEYDIFRNEREYFY